MNQEPEFSDLSQSERDWIDQQVLYSKELGVDPGSTDSVSDFFDSMLAAVARGAEPPESANIVVNLVGVLIGEQIVAQSRLRWEIVTDSHGTELCLHDPRSSWTLFPQSSVAKRWESKEVGWVKPFVLWALQETTGEPS